MVDDIMPQERLEFHVYMLLREDGSPFYVGKGCKNRPRDHWRPSSLVGTAPKVHIIRRILATGKEVSVVKVADGLSESDAFALERETIARIGRHPNGPLWNMTDGGEGAKGLRHSDAFKAILSERMKSAMSSEEVKSAVSEASKARWRSSEFRAALCAAIRASHTTPEARAAKRAATMANWLDPEVRRRRLSAQRLAVNSPEFRERQRVAKSTVDAIAEQSARAAAQWADPASRELLLEAQNEGKRLAAEARRSAISPEDAARIASERKLRVSTAQRARRMGRTDEQIARQLEAQRDWRVRNADRFNAERRVDRAAALAAMTQEYLAEHKAKIAEQNRAARQRAKARRNSASQESFASECSARS